ncbi:sensor histidine kinase [Caldicellulosiruptor acetigenus]|uniref:Signal transduction histidine-protein kinase ArlS n=1 Tax=Caldicellulosiruptor acetigenus 6A TaxID=632516 RepID=G2PW57_9FIRM|nr:ATP-binding protein [Caldicellulosiruptor acetigenus]AEM74658.1 integral membrane sensor signal transduction histidine kinase [Caldicellulosiruptor acetigenus 6A]
MKINILKFRKISWRITFTYAVVFSAVVILLNFLVLYGVRFYLRQQAITQVDSIGKNIEGKILGVGDEQKDIYDKELVNDSVINSDINIKIADSSGKILNNSKNFNPQVSIKANPNNVMVVENEEKHLIVKNFVISDNGKIIGYVQVAKNMNREYSFLKLLFIVLLVADAIGMITSVITGFSISQKILKPIKEITNTAKRITATDLNVKINVGEVDDELSNLAKTFNEMIERLKISFEKQNQFVSDASHELRTPLSVINGYINLIDRWGKNDKEVLQESIVAIKNEVKYMTELVERLLFLARGDSGVIKLQKEVVNLNQLVEEIVKEGKLVAPNRNWSYNHKGRIDIFADGRLMKQMLRAIIDNSIKFTQEGGTINISVEKHLDKVKIVVKDNGIGIPREEIGKIFDRFYRVDKVRSKTTGGSGLGLSIVKWIVEAHNGEILVESELGKGTEVSVLLPM